MSTESDRPADFKVGDIVNGHRLSAQPDGSLAWLPLDSPAPAPTPVPAKKSKKALWITLGSVGGVLLLIVIIGSLNRPSAKEPVAAAATAAATETPVEEVEAEPAKLVVPDVTGLTATAATAVLSAAGFEVPAVEDMAATVTGTSPAKGGIAVAKSTVTLTVEVKPKLTLSQQNAVSKGQSYLAMMGFSRTGLIEQLEFEGFSTEDSTFAADFLAPDWNAEAAEKAKSYLEMMAFSRDGLYEQLAFEGFEAGQIEAGLAAVGY
ncbi:Ltp family lipoprotein [Agromyces subbeticus]|uniref:Ltp family lipoprotein n=1 Tax=Agromyces subbeticus TaxID=293890 RepID=UPI0003B68288|nr:Ltp family lipoprotein [Agromyces subbeticus]